MDSPEQVSELGTLLQASPACKALASELYGAGPLVAAIIWAF